MELDVALLRKYGKYKVGELRKIAVRHFNRFVRDRDEGKPCVSCGKRLKLQAGHFYSAGHYPCLEFEETNVHGQCVRCNMFLSGNLNEYRKRIVKRIGEDGLKKLDDTADYYRKKGWKHDRFYLIGIIEKYKYHG